MEPSCVLVGDTTTSLTNATTTSPIHPLIRRAVVCRFTHLLRQTLLHQGYKGLLPSQTQLPQVVFDVGCVLLLVECLFLFSLVSQRVIHGSGCLGDWYLWRYSLYWEPSTGGVDLVQWVQRYAPSCHSSFEWHNMKILSCKIDTCHNSTLISWTNAFLWVVLLNPSCSSTFRSCPIKIWPQIIKTATTSRVGNREQCYMHIVIVVYTLHIFKALGWQLNAWPVFLLHC